MGGRVIGSAACSQVIHEVTCLLAPLSVPLSFAG